MNERIADEKSFAFARETKISCEHAVCMCTYVYAIRQIMSTNYAPVSAVRLEPFYKLL